MEKEATDEMEMAEKEIERRETQKKTPENENSMISLILSWARHCIS